MNLPLPDLFLDSLEGLPGFDRNAFKTVHANPDKPISIRLNPLKWKISATPAGHPTGMSQDEFANYLFGHAEKIPWSSAGYYLNQRPDFTFDPCLHAGVYYVQEASSTCLEEAIKQSVDLSASLRVLDLCAAPGGKSTLIQSLLSPSSLLISNEVIKSRVPVMQENMIKWGGANGLISNQDPMTFSRLENYFDLMLIDAPCSGSGLFRKEPDAIIHWSEENVKTCAFRQQRIIGDAWKALKKEGILIYSTCSYSASENEEILDWMAEQLAVETVALSLDPEWDIVESISPAHKFRGYRFYPDRLKGEGFFMACLRKKDGLMSRPFKTSRPDFDMANKNELQSIQEFVRRGESLFILKQDDLLYAMPQSWKEEFGFLRKSLYLKKSGVLLGKWSSKGLIPDHELALSGILSADVQNFTVNRSDAIRFLRKEPLKIDLSSLKGWALVRYLQQNLGWVKILGNRVNNYYPMDWRIRKQDHGKGMSDPPDIAIH